MSSNSTSRSRRRFSSGVGPELPSYVAAPPSSEHVDLTASQMSRLIASQGKERNTIQVQRVRTHVRSQSADVPTQIHQVAATYATRPKRHSAKLPLNVLAGNTADTLNIVDPGAMRRSSKRNSLHIKQKKRESVSMSGDNSMTPFDSSGTDEELEVYKSEYAMAREKQAECRLLEYIKESKECPNRYVLPYVVSTSVYNWIGGADHPGVVSEVAFSLFKCTHKSSRCRTGVFSWFSASLCLHYFFVQEHKRQTERDPSSASRKQNSYEEFVGQINQLVRQSAEYIIKLVCKRVENDLNCGIEEALSPTAGLYGSGNKYLVASFKRLDEFAQMITDHSIFSSVRSFILRLLIRWLNNTMLSTVCGISLSINQAIQFKLLISVFSEWLTKIDMCAAEDELQPSRDAGNVLCLVSKSILLNKTEQNNICPTLHAGHLHALLKHYNCDPCEAPLSESLLSTLAFESTKFPSPLQISIPSFSKDSIALMLREINNFPAPFQEKELFLPIEIAQCPGFEFLKDFQHCCAPQEEVW